MGDSREKVPSQEFWLTQPRFLQQVGDEAPKLVRASPSSKAKVVLPAQITREFAKRGPDGKLLRGPDGRVIYETQTVPHPEDAHLKRVKPGEEPEKPKSVAPNSRVAPVKKSGAQPAAESGGRAADKQ